LARRARRLENLAILRLRAMSELKDIGIVTSQIEFAVRGDPETSSREQPRLLKKLRTDEAHLR
jgi:hypothetical protein